MIESINQMVDHFMEISCEHLYVSTSVRNTWMLNHMTFAKSGYRCNIRFKDMGDGVWMAEYFVINPPYSMPASRQTSPDFFGSTHQQ